MSSPSKDGKGDYSGGAIDPNKLGFKPPAQQQQKKPPDDLFDKPPKSWPELVGVDGEKAKEQILADIPGLNVIVLPKNSPTTRDYRLDRVRVFVNEDGTVASAPAQG